MAPATKTCMDKAVCLILDQFIVAGKQHGVLPGDGAAPDGVDANVPFLPGTDPIPPADFVERAAGFDGLGQHFGSAAGGIDLFVVVFFNDLDVKGIGKHRCDDLQDLLHHIDAQGGVLGADHRRIGRQLLAHGLLGPGYNRWWR